MSIKHSLIAAGLALGLIAGAAPALAQPGPHNRGYDRGRHVGPPPRVRLRGHRPKCRMVWVRHHRERRCY